MMVLIREFRELTLIFSSIICLFGGNVAGSVDAPAIHKMSAIVELLSPCLRSALSALTGALTKPDASGAQVAGVSE